MGQTQKSCTNFSEGQRGAKEYSTVKHPKPLGYSGCKRMGMKQDNSFQGVEASACHRWGYCTGKMPTNAEKKMPGEHRRTGSLAIARSPGTAYQKGAPLPGAILRTVGKKQLLHACEQKVASKSQANGSSSRQRVKSAPWDTKR